MRVLPTQTQATANTGLRFSLSQRGRAGGRENLPLWPPGSKVEMRSAPYQARGHRSAMILPTAESSLKTS